jgi:predicted acetyltransferase
MTKPAPKSSAHIEVLPATAEQAPILANLLQLYAHDFSEFHHLDLNPDGRFSYRDLPFYWSDSDRRPFLVTIDGKLAGFVLIKKGSEISGNAAAWDMAEFFVIRVYRRQGIGTQIAQEVWKRFPGPWEVRVMESNVPAREFWARAISTFVGETIQPMRIEKDGGYWEFFAFESGPNSTTRYSTPGIHGRDLP